MLHELPDENIVVSVASSEVDALGVEGAPEGSEAAARAEAAAARRGEGGEVAFDIPTNTKITHAYNLFTA